MVLPVCIKAAGHARERVQAVRCSDGGNNDIRVSWNFPVGSTNTAETHGSSFHRPKEVLVYCGILDYFRQIWSALL